MKLIKFKKHNIGYKNTQRILRVFGTVWFSCAFYGLRGWFRLFGRGLAWKHKSMGLSFSERYGYTKYIRIGKWIVKYLPSKS